MYDAYSSPNVSSIILSSALMRSAKRIPNETNADLGTYWSITLEVRESHRLITQGVYRRVRHPMYAALFRYSIGQALVLPNWVEGRRTSVATLLADHSLRDTHCATAFNCSCAH